MSCGCNRGGGSEWIWIIVAVIVILCLFNDNNLFGGLLGGDCGCAREDCC